MSINREWDHRYKMPKNPTLDQRIAWHLDHQKQCPCRKIGDKLAAEMKKRGIKF